MSSTVTPENIQVEFEDQTEGEFDDEQDRLEEYIRRPLV